jgi:hypothetical protein
VLGLTQEEVRHKFDDIVEFSELGDFIDMPVKHYSSGMYMRLGFSVAIHVDPDILIVDEILAVGDQAFQTKCIDRIHEMHRAGVSIILISHNLNVVRRMCTTLIWLENGRMRAAGPTDEIANQYKYQSDTAIGRQLAAETAGRSYNRWGSREIEITGFRFLNADGVEQSFYQTGDAMTIEMDYVAHKPVARPEFGLAIYRQDGQQVNGPNSQLAGLDIGVVEGAGTIKYHIRELPLLPALYQVTAAIHNAQLTHAYDYHELAYPFRIVSGGTKETDGLIALPANWTWQDDTEKESSEKNR